MKRTNCSYLFIYNRLSGAGKGYLATSGSNWMTYEDDNVKLIMHFTPTGSLEEVKAIWYANKYQCLRFTDLTEEGVNKYLKLFNIVCE